MPQPTLQDRSGALHVPKTMIIGTHVLKGGTYFSPKSEWYPYVLQHASPEQRRLLGLMNAKLPDFSVDASAPKAPGVPTGGSGGGSAPMPLPGGMPAQAAPQEPRERGNVHVGAVDIHADEEVPKDSPLYWYVMHHAKPEQLAELGIAPEERPIAAQENEAAAYAKHKKTFDKLPLGEVPVSPLIHAITGGEQVLQFSSEEFPVHVNPRLVTEYFRKVTGRRLAALPPHVQGAIEAIKRKSSIVVNRLQDKLDRGGKFGDPANEKYVAGLYSSLQDAFDVLCVGKPFVGYRAVSRSVVQEMFDRGEIRGSELVEAGYSNMSLCVLTAARELRPNDLGFILKLIVPAIEPAIYTDLMFEKGECEIVLEPVKRYSIVDRLPTFLPIQDTFVPVYTALVG